MLLRCLIIMLLMACVWVLPLKLQAADSTSFNPVPIIIKAEGGGGVPVGTVIAWPVASSPKDADKWLECNGQSVSQIVYPELFALVGSTTPDYRGLFLRGHGSQTSTHYGTVIHASAGLGQLQGDAIRNITGRVAGSTSNPDVQIFGETPIDAVDVSGAFSAFWEETWTSEQDSRKKTHLSGFEINASKVVPTASENRPANRAVRYLIRALP